VYIYAFKRSIYSTRLITKSNRYERLEMSGYVFIIDRAPELNYWLIPTDVISDADWNDLCECGKYLDDHSDEEYRIIEKLYCVHIKRRDGSFGMLKRSFRDPEYVDPEWEEYQIDTKPFNPDRRIEMVICISTEDIDRNCLPDYQTAIFDDM